MKYFEINLYLKLKSVKIDTLKELLITNTGSDIFRIEK